MDQGNATPNAADLNKLKLVELRTMAAQRGLKGTSRMRKPDIVAALAQEGAAPTLKQPSTETHPRHEKTAKTDQTAAPQRRGTTEKEIETVPTQETGDVPKEHQSPSSAHSAETESTGELALDIRQAVAEDLETTKKRRGGQDTDDNQKTETSEKGKKLEQIALPEGGEQGRSRSRRDRNARRRGRDRNDRGGDRNGRRDVSTEPTPDTELVPIAGILDVQSNHAFVRTSGYLPGDSDVYVTLGNVRRWGLRGGDAVVGAVRPAREGDRRQQKYNALVRIDSINGMTVEQAQERRVFSKLTPEYPTEQLRLETTPKAMTPRVIDLVSPIGKGQRGLIVSPPKAGKTMIIQQIAKSIEVNNPEVHLMVVLVDERPEEVTDMRSIVNGEVIASTFDRPPSDHTIVAELAIERAKRLVEMGQDVVVLLDSLTRLSRAYNLAAPASGRILSGGVDAAALYPPKKFFGAARKLREGGSLTIVASALVETGSKMDEVIFEEFKGTGNMELRLARQLADRRIFPAIDVNASGTRREEMLFQPEELRIMWRLRRVLGNLDQQSALELILGKLQETQTNAEFLMLVQKTTPKD